MKTNDVRVILPTSKSLSNRWLIANHVVGNTYVLRNISEAEDTQLLSALLAQLRRGSSSHFYCHNAGSVARFMMALLALTPGKWTLSGDDRLKQRPMEPLIRCLRSLGAVIECTEQPDSLPAVIHGVVPTHKMAEIDPVVSSQFVSAMLLVGALMPDGLRLTLTGRASSRPYIQMTQLVLEQAGIVNSVSRNNRVYKVSSLSERLPQRLRVIDIERDWSAAAYIYGMAALRRNVRIRMQGLTRSGTLQGDSVVADIFQLMGVVTNELRSPYRPQLRSITVEGRLDHQPSIEWNFIDCPDLLPVVVTVSAALGMHAKLKGIKNLHYKESDRLMALQTELRRMGGHMTFSDTEVHVIPTNLKPVEPVRTYNDHRIAMAFGILRLCYPNLTVDNPDCVNKSFPGFWEQLALVESGRM